MKVTILNTKDYHQGETYKNVQFIEHLPEFGIFRIHLGNNHFVCYDDKIYFMECKR